MNDIHIFLSKPDDGEILVNVSKRAFHSDVNFGGVGEGGPPGYDSPQWQIMMMGKSDYYKITLNGKIIGGAIVFRKSKRIYYLGRIFIDPEYHRKGFGKEAMQLIMDKYPFAKKWTLETPPWNTRTREFYKKQGFTITSETNEDLFFEKDILNRTASN